MGNSSRLVVIEGLDGSGKSTQFERLKSILSDNNIDYRAISFPEYDKPSSALVKMYLSGDFSKDAAEVNAYAASSFYAVDRYASYKLYWEKDYSAGKCILAARYVTSNAVYQMTKLPREEWDGYLEWLCDYEYNKLGLPRPDAVIFLDMPVAVSQRLISGRYQGDEAKKDIHEGNIEFLESCRRTALYSAKRLGWEVINCADGGEPLDVDEVTGILKNKVLRIFSV